MGLAQKAEDRGDLIRAAVVLLEGLRRHPHLIPEHLPRTLEIFADAVHGAGLESELLSVLVHWAQPDVALSRLYDALEERGKNRAIEAIERARARHPALAHIEVLRGPVGAEATRPLEQRRLVSDGGSREAQRSAFETQEKDEHDDAMALSVVARGGRAGAVEARLGMGGGGVGAGHEPSQRHFHSRGAGAPAVSAPLSREPGRYERHHFEDNRSKALRSARSRQYVPPEVEALRVRQETGRPPHRRGGLTLPVGGGQAKSVSRGPRILKVSNVRSKSPSSEATAQDGEVVYREHVLSGDRRSQPKMPTLSSAKSVDDLLSEAVMAAETELKGTHASEPHAPDGGGSDFRPPVDGRRRTWRNMILGVAVLAVLAAVALIVYQRMDEAELEARLTSSVQAAQGADLSSLQQARAESLEGHVKWPDNTRLFAQAMLFDRLIGTRFPDQSFGVNSDDAPAQVEHEPAFLVARVLELLHTGEKTAEAKQLVLDTPKEHWNRMPGFEAWAVGLVLAAEGRTQDAAKAFAASADKHAIPTLPLLDLAGLAMASRQPRVVALFLERAQPLRGKHPLIEVVSSVLHGDVLTPPQEAVISSLDTLDPSELSLTQATWFWFARAHRELHAGALELASASVTSGLALSPREPGLLLLRALVLTARDRGDEALDSFREALTRFEQTEPKRAAQARSHASSVLREAGRPDLVVALFSGTKHADSSGALEDARQAVGDAPPLDLVAADQVLGQAVSKGSFDAAFQRAAELSTAQPDVWTFLRVRAELMAINGQGVDAAKLLTTWARGFPVHTRRSIYSGLVLSRAGTLKQAEAATLATLDTTDLELLEAQAEIAWRAGLFEEARARTQEVLVARQNSPMSMAIVGLMGWGAGAFDDRPAQVIEHLRKGTASGHLAVPGLTLTLAKAYRASGQSYLAIDTLESAMGRPADQLTAVDALGALYLETGLHRKGSRALREMLLKTPDAPNNRKLRGIIELWIGTLELASEPDSSSAYRHLKRARLSLGDEPRVLYRLGQAEEARNRKKTARELYARAVEVEPTYGEARKALARLGGAPPPEPKPAPNNSTNPNDASPSTTEPSGSARDVTASDLVNIAEKKPFKPTTAQARNTTSPPRTSTADKKKRSTARSTKRSSKTKRTKKPRASSSSSSTLASKKKKRRKPKASSSSKRGATAKSPQAKPTKNKKGVERKSTLALEPWMADVFVAPVGGAVDLAARKVLHVVR